MKGKSTMKKLVLCMILGLLLAGLAVPVSAATYKKSKSVTVKKGQSYHLMNKNISKNKIKNCTITLKAGSGTQYDIVMAYADQTVCVKNNSTKTEKIPISGQYLSYLKSSVGSNQGMLACIKVNKGKVKVTVSYNTDYNKGALTFVKQKSSHKALKSVSAAKNKKVLLEMKGGNMKNLPVVFSGKSKTAIRRSLDGSLNGTAMREIYTVSGKSLLYKYYENKTMKESRKISCDTKSGSTCNTLVLMNGKYSGWMTTGKGTMTYYYPADYLKISAKKK